ncbi:MAG: hypothetical protein ACTSRP_17230 [Candidatus Helarchaeota archaeon]
MCSGIVGGTIEHLGLRVINKLLSQKDTTIFKIRSVYINGNNQTIQLFIYLNKSTYKGRKFKQRVRELLGLRDDISFNKDYDIHIRNSLNNEDITDEVIEYDAAKKIIKLNKLIGLTGKTFILDISGPFPLDSNRIFDCIPNREPKYDDDHNRVYNIKIVIFDKFCLTEELFLISIPIEIPFPVEFVSKNLLTKKQQKLLHLIDLHLDDRKKYNRYKKDLEQSLGLDPDELKSAIASFLGILERRVRIRFSEFLTVNTSSNRVFISKCVIDFPRVGKGYFPRILIVPTICFDYQNNDDKIIDIDLNINKEKLIKIAKKAWSKIKHPKPTHPKKIY